jgi:hypothetical protein
MFMTERFKVYENAEGTVIEIDGHPIQFSLILSDEQIGKYLLSRGEQKRSAEIAKSSPEYWQGACRQ